MIIPLGKTHGYTLTAAQFNELRTLYMDTLKNEDTCDWPMLNSKTALERGQVICLSFNNYKLVSAIRGVGRFGVHIECILNSNGEKFSTNSKLNWSELYEAKYKIM